MNCFKTLSAFINASSNIAGLSEKDFNNNPIDPDHSKARLDIVENYNKSGQEWDRDYPRLGMLLQLEHNSDAELDSDLREIDAAVEAYASCADRWRRKHDDLEPHEVRLACMEKRSDLEGKISKYIRRVVFLRSPNTIASVHQRPSGSNPRGTSSSGK
jgi:hypothetical protein